MKLPQLLSQYLYQTKRLDLPGIGSFTLDAGAVIPQESDRVGQVPASGIHFANANIPTPDDALINFLKEHTGKMRSLVSSDLDFFLTTGKQLLNIGKPFYLEGIGTLLKNKEGKFEFTPGEYLVTKLSDLHHPDKKGAAAAAAGLEEGPREESSWSTNSRQTLLLVAIVAGLVVIAWGGYYLYKRNNYTEPTTVNQARVVPETTATKPVDTSALAAKPGDSAAVGGGSGGKDTLAHAATANAPDAAAAKPAATPGAPAVNPPPVVGTVPVPAAGQSLYHFVILRTENKNHALRRFNQLLGYQLNIKMETKDSTFFKLYFPIAAAIKDTTHIRDSLADVYASHITIEQY